jgi:hypothetical protein
MPEYADAGEIVPMLHNIRAATVAVRNRKRDMMMWILNNGRHVSKGMVGKGGRNLAISAMATQS